jgi:hypothetical protein
MRILERGRTSKLAYRVGYPGLTSLEFLVQLGRYDELLNRQGTLEGFFDDSHMASIRRWRDTSAFAYRSMDELPTRTSGIKVSAKQEIKEVVLVFNPGTDGRYRQEGGKR